MPRNVRNFWLELNVDGSQTRIETGPRAKDGGFQLTIRQRDKGDIIRALEIWGYADEHGELTVRVRNVQDDTQMAIKTQR